MQPRWVQTPIITSHGSQYDTAGRVRIGPAPENLAIPPYKFVSDQKIKIG